MPIWRERFTVGTSHLSLSYNAEGPENSLHKFPMSRTIQKHTLRWVTGARTCINIHGNKWGFMSCLIAHFIPSWPSILADLTMTMADMTQYVWLKSARAQSTSPKGGHLDWSRERLWCKWKHASVLTFNLCPFFAFFQVCFVWSAL